MHLESESDNFTVIMAYRQTRDFTFVINISDVDESIHNDDYWDSLKTMADYISVQEEKSENDFHHLQGFVTLKKKITASGSKKFFPDPEAVSVQPAENPDVLARYSVKETSRVDGGYAYQYGDYLDRGNRMLAGKLRVRGDKRGPASELISDRLEKRQRAVDVICDNPTRPVSALCEEFPEEMLNVDKLRKLERERAAEEETEAMRREFLANAELRQWQENLYRKLRETPGDSRSIKVYVDTRGNTGKSYFCDYYDMKHPGESLFLENAKKADMKYAASKAYKPAVIFIDLVRSDSECINYAALEAIINGRFLNVKYESGVHRMRMKHHTVLFCNGHLDYSKMSYDRWFVYEAKKTPHGVTTYVRNEDIVKQKFRDAGVDLDYE